MSTKYLICPIIFICIFTCKKAKAQNKYFTKTGKIEFVAVKDRGVNAISRSCTVVLNAATGEFQFSVLVKSFEFKKAYMQEKFNNQILETDQFPKAEFKGSIENPYSVNYQKDGIYQVQVKGLMTLHGVTRDISVKGTLSVSKGLITASSTFNISIDNYNISNPGIGDGNISITVECQLEAMKN